MTTSPTQISSHRARTKRAIDDYFMSRRWARPRPILTAEDLLARLQFFGNRYKTMSRVELRHWLQWMVEKNRQLDDRLDHAPYKIEGIEPQNMRWAAIEDVRRSVGQEIATMKQHLEGKS